MRARAEGEGVEIESCSDKEKAKAGWGEKRERFLDPCCSFCREFLSLSLLPAFFVSFNRFCLCGSFVEGCPAGRVPSLIGKCHSAEGKINRWPFLASPPSSCPYKYFYLHSVTVAIAYPFAFALSG